MNKYPALRPISYVVTTLAFVGCEPTSAVSESVTRRSDAVYLSHGFCPMERRSKDMVPYFYPPLVRIQGVWCGCSGEPSIEVIGNGYISDRGELRRIHFESGSFRFDGMVSTVRLLNINERDYLGMSATPHTDTLFYHSATDECRAIMVPRTW